jgi:hypothetical protein
MSAWSVRRLIFVGPQLVTAACHPPGARNFEVASRFFKNMYTALQCESSLNDMQNLGLYPNNKTC